MSKSRVSKQWLVVENEDYPGWEWHFDIPLMLSGFECIYGKGCQGVFEGHGEEIGCCGLGVHLQDDPDKVSVSPSGDEFASDVDRINRLIPLLDDDVWQHRKQGEKRWLSKLGNDSYTRKYQGGCIFLNRKGYKAGSGCAFHLQALRNGDDPMEWKPATCVTIPLQFDVFDDVQLVLIGSHKIADWFPGLDVDTPEDKDWMTNNSKWWCADSDEAYSGKLPTYIASEKIIRSHVGDDIYETAKTYFDSLRRSIATSMLPQTPVEFSGVTRSGKTTHNPV